MNNIVKGMIAGFAGTVALSILMAMKSAMGVMPNLDIIKMLAGMVGAPIAVGWIVHFTIGTIAWGGAFAVLNDHVPGDSEIKKGLVFGVAAWLAMMLAVMPMAGAGFFGLNFGIMAPVMTLVLHLVFGAVMGWTYARLPSADAKMTA
ncbi:hypothetical protein EDD52_1338 [Primorskyibacter sedentarius]|uniref:Uncharacterized protein n=1 Tax=Primorskyibacter sedentarius TaxID=745311 RepID=A0A4R3ITU0_9RHOB|nr:DUF6789 family protein [Primorskyibacter sedentarius]TCS54470.1 hypothetical protein EDD52_1338 [Primorskyibacter sedentarius]